MSSLRACLTLSSWLCHFTPSTSESPGLSGVFKTAVCHSGDNCSKQKGPAVPSRPLKCRACFFLDPDCPEGKQDSSQCSQAWSLTFSLVSHCIRRSVSTDVLGTFGLLKKKEKIRNEHGDPACPLLLILCTLILSLWNHSSRDRHVATACPSRVCRSLMSRWTHDSGQAKRILFWDSYHIHEK